MPLLMIGGLAALIFGTIMFFVWLEAVLTVVKAIIPLGLVGTGAAAVYLGWEEFRDFKKPVPDFSSPGEANRYQTEAKAYQAEMKELRRNQDGSEGSASNSGAGD